jgi:ATP-dependent Clp protease, protease subunit
MAKRCLMLSIVGLAALLPGCYFPRLQSVGATDGPADAIVDFNDPVLNHRQILLFGMLDQRTAEITIQKLLYLDAKNHEPIDIYLQTPGGEFKDAMAIEQTMRLIQSPVNTYAMSECNSGGVVLLAAGTGKRRAFHGAVVIVHGMKIVGQAPADLIDRVQDAYTDFWRQHAKLPEAWLPLPRDIMHVLSAEQALEFGLVDEVITK